MARKTQDNHGQTQDNPVKVEQSWKSWKDRTILEEKRHRTIMKRRQTEGNHTIFIRTDQLLVDEVVALVEDVLCARQHARLSPQLCQL